VNEFGFTGRYLDKETGLWYFRARYYSGSLGRFMSRDPAGYVDGYQLYRAWMIPNFLDPTGLALETDCTSDEITVDFSETWRLPRAIATLGGSGALGWRASIKGKKTTCPCYCKDKKKITLELTAEAEAFGELTVNYGPWTGSVGLTATGNVTISASKDCDGAESGTVSVSITGKLYASFGAGRQGIASAGIWAEGKFGAEGSGDATVSEAKAELKSKGDIEFGVYASIAWVEYRRSLGQANWSGEPIGLFSVSY